MHRVPSRSMTLTCAVALGLHAGCLPTDSAVTCADGLVCAAPRVCAPAGGGCLDPDQVEACLDKPEGDACSLPGLAAGQCVDGACVAAGCGDGQLDAIEVCDDGNRTSGDGCRADCAKLEVCGDGVVDSGEACDDGNLNPGDACDACVANAWQATARVGGNTRATDVGMAPGGLALDRAGNLFIADEGNGQIYRVDADSGVRTTVAGRGGAGFAGDGGPASVALFNQPSDVAIDGLGNLFIADRENHRIRKIDAATGTVTTIAGSGVAGNLGDDGPATSAQLNAPRGVAVDGLGNVFIADSGNRRIRRVDGTTGRLTAYAGTGASGYAGDGGPALAALLSGLAGLAVDPAGALVLVDGNRVRRVDAATGIITTIAGTGLVDEFGSGYFAGDGGPATAATFDAPHDVALDAAGDLFIADAWNHRVRRVDATTGIIDTIAGTMLPDQSVDGAFSGDGGDARDAQFAYVTSVAVAASGDVLITDGNNARVRRVSAATGIVTTIAGDGSRSVLGDGGAATSAKLLYPTSVALDGEDAVLIADNFNFRIRRLELSTGVIATVVGNGRMGFSGDGGRATDAAVNGAAPVVVDPDGNTVFVDYFNFRIRRVDAATGIVTTIAGTGQPASTGDGGPATAAAVWPRTLAIDAAGNIYVGETYSIRRIDAATGTIATIAGGPASGFAGDGGPASLALFNVVGALAVDGAGDLLVADAFNGRVRRIDHATGFITTIAGTGATTTGGDGGPALDAQLYPTGLAVDGADNVFVADGNRVRRIDAATGIIDTVAGGAVRGFTGDGGDARQATIGPRSLAASASGDVYFANDDCHCIRRVDGATGVITTVAGAVAPPGMGPMAQGQFADPRALTLTPELALVAGGASGTVQAVRRGPAWLEAVAGRYPQAAATGDLARFQDASFGSVGGVAFDAGRQRIYLTETTTHQVHAVTLVDPLDAATWTIAPLANVAGIAGTSDGAATTARFRAPTGLFYDPIDDQLLVVDRGNHAVRSIDLTAMTVVTLAGQPGTLGFFGDGLAATDALLDEPEAVTRCPNGDWFIADSANQRIRRVEVSSRTISTVLGDGTAASSGQGAPAWSFPIDRPRGLACDADGNVIASSSTAVRLLAADDDGRVDGEGDVVTIYGATPRDTFPASVTTCLAGVALVAPATVWVTDACLGMLVELQRHAGP